MDTLTVKWTAHERHDEDAGELGPGHCHGKLAAPLLDSASAFERNCRSRRTSGPRADPQRKAARLSRQRGPPGTHQRVLLAPRSVALLRTQRRQRNPLQLPRTEVRHPWQLRRRATGATGVRKDVDHRVPLHRTRRNCMGLHGSKGQAAPTTWRRVGEPA